MTVIRSPNRSPRLPPGHSTRVTWPPVKGPVPPFDIATWDLALFPKPLIDATRRFTWPELLALPRTKVLADYHSVDGWSRLDNLWDGVSTAEIVRQVRLASEVIAVTIHSEFGLSVSLPLAEFLADDVLLAYRHDGADLTLEQGGPLRLIVPRLLDDQSPRWVRGIEFMK